jgi:O-antigen/teichoic acid export membrane protein
VLAVAGFRWVALTWLLTQIAATFMAVPTALQDYALVSTASTIISTVSVIVGLLVLVAGGGLIPLLQVRFVWSLAAISIWVWLAGRLMPGLSFWPRWDGAAFRRTFRFASWQGLGGLGGTLAQQTDKYVLGAYLSPAAVGVYNLAWSLMGVLNISIYKMGEVLFPAISAMEGANQREQAGSLMMRASWFLGVLMVVLLGSVGIFAHDVLRLYVGKEIADAGSLLLQVLIVSVILSSASIAPAQYLLGVGCTNWTAAATFASGLVVLVCGLTLVPHFGLLGAGWGQVLMVIATRPLLHYLLWRQFLRPAVAERLFFAYLYGPVFTGALAVVVLAFARSFVAWEPGLIITALDIGGSMLILTAVVLAVDQLMPGGGVRRAELRHLAVAVWNTIARRRTRLGAAK